MKVDIVGFLRLPTTSTFFVESARISITTGSADVLPLSSHFLCFWLKDIDAVNRKSSVALHLTQGGGLGSGERLARLTSRCSLLQIKKYIIHTLKSECFGLNMTYFLHIMLQ